MPAPEVLDGRIAEAVGRALEQHRDELAELVARQVDAELERLAGELVAETLARRNGNGLDVAGATVLESPAAERAADETKRCSTGRRELPRADFGRDRRTRDGLRARCGECRSRREYAVTRRTRARRERAAAAAHGLDSGDEEPHPDPAHAENGKTALNGSRASPSPTVDEWLVESGFATLEHGRLVATAAGLEVGSALELVLDG